MAERAARRCANSTALVSGRSRAQDLVVAATDLVRLPETQKLSQIAG